MFLKSLYISGFKSFAYPTKIEFSDDISAIIGPNGSGKSNISDAIRFVLGEQRTKLMRSQNMQDIIFSGTDSENPRGVAHVQLVLAREEKPDLIIERKYYRTGESEYLLNGKKVRLKDIHSEFWDTGLGKNGYSIISQGGVENIVGASPSELRSLVEEAVGIAGYKVQQSETLKRLEMIESNIERVSDILDEMQRQLKPLKKQADKTRQYLEIFNTLKDIDLVNFFDKEQSYQIELEQLNNNLINSNFSIIDLDKLADEKDVYYLKLKQERSENKDLIKSLKHNIESINQDETNRLIEENNVTNQLNNNNHIIEQYQIRNEEINRIINKDKENLNYLKLLIKEAKQKHSNLKKITETDLSELEKLKNQLEGIKLIKDPEHLNELKNNIDQLKTERIELELKLKQFKLNHKESQERISQLDNQRKLIDNNIARNQNKKDSLLKELKKIQKEEKELEELIKQDSEKQSLYNNQLQEINNNLRFENNIKNSYSGFREAVRSIMNYVKNNSLSGVFGTVSDLFNTEQKFEIAIQIALGGSLQNIVVKDSNIAKRLIDNLKQTKKGRATFIPLDFDNNFKINQDLSVLNLPGVIGFADSLISTDQKFSKIFKKLLGRTLILESYVDAQNFRKSNSKYNLVTLEGECFYANGSIVGGSINKKSSFLINNRSKITELQKQKKNLESIIKTLDQKIKEKTDKLNKQKVQINRLENQLKDINNRLFQFSSQIDLITNSISDLLKKSTDTTNLKNELEKKENQLYKLNKEYELVQKDSSLLIENQEQLSNQILKQQEIVSNDKIKENEVYQEIISFKKQIALSEEQIKQNQIKVKDNNNAITKINNEIRVGDSLLRQLKQTQDNLQKQLLKNTKELTEQEARQNSLESSWLKVEEEIKNINKEKISEVEAKSKIERRIDKIELKRKNLSENIFDKYNMNLSAIENQIDTIRNSKKDLTDSEVNQLRIKLKEMGSVNLNAVESYKELRERFDHLKNNYDDLQESKRDIEETINTLNKTMSKQFSEKFIQLNELFTKIFSILFEGGKARLDYQDPEDILNSGIQLYAQPPGKHLKNINLLSGGEKAMTAIALLLTFIQLNPTPFVIIDEIDAALDDNNINRFSRYIKRVREGNQFIIITHRKGTIQICNNIHGISMNKDGISRCCSFELSDYLE